MNPYFQGKRVIVTGAGKGIERALCITLAKLGAKVIAISRTAENLDNLKLEDSSIEVHTQDISEWGSTRKLIEDIGQVDMLVNNAALCRMKPYLEVTEEDFDWYADFLINDSTFHESAVVKCMVKKRTGGAIVNVSSIAGINAINSFRTQCCSKAALDMMTKTMALEFGPHQIRINSVNPTAVITDEAKAFLSAPGVADSILKRIPTGRFSEEIDVVNAIVFLLSDKASMINGIHMPVDGGHLQCAVFLVEFTLRNICY